MRSLEQLVQDLGQRGVRMHVELDVLHTRTRTSTHAS